MNVNLKKNNNRYLLQFITLKEKEKGKENEKIHKINLKEKIKIKNNFIHNQLIYLTSKSQYEKELDRIENEKKYKFQIIKIKNKESKIKKKKEIKILNKNQKIFKSCSNKMILDIILSDEKIKKKFFSDNKKYKNNFEKETKNIIFSPQYKECHIDNIQLISNQKENKIINKLKHSLSLSYANLDNIKIDENFPYIIRKPSLNIKNHFISNKKNKINTKEKQVISSPKSLKITSYSNTIDETKGMLTINYSYFRRNKNKSKISIKKFSPNFMLFKTKNKNRSLSKN